jgi:hypothetical protein
MRLGEWMCPCNRFLDFTSGTEAACPPMREHSVGILSSYPLIGDELFLLY